MAFFFNMLGHLKSHQPECSTGKKDATVKKTIRIQSNNSKDSNKHPILSGSNVEITHSLGSSSTNNDDS